jgi:hypothetical protein
MSKGFTIWDYNICLALPSGGPKDQQTIRRDHGKVAQSMKKYQTVEWVRDEPVKSGPVVKMVLVEPGQRPTREDRAAFAEMNRSTAPTRLTIFGHGDPGSQTVGGRSPGALAFDLKYDFGLRRVGKISLVACYAGGNYDRDQRECLNDSFADRFHRALLLLEVLPAYLTARTGAMTTKHNEEGKVERRVYAGDELLRKGAAMTKFVWTYRRDGLREIEPVYNDWSKRH